MVVEQCVARGLRDERVLQAMRTVPRHEFVRRQDQSRAHADHPLGIGHGQTISQPYMVALMTEALQPGPADRVLEIGTGSGYQTAILASLVRRVYSVERIAELAREAQARLDRLGYENVEYLVGDGTLGWPEQAPFDSILVTAGAPELPPSLEEQLGENARLVIPVGQLQSQMLTVLERRGGKRSRRSLCPCIFVQLIGREGWDAR